MRRREFENGRDTATAVACALAADAAQFGILVSVVNAPFRRKAISQARNAGAWTSGTWEVNKHTVKA